MSRTTWFLTVLFWCGAIALCRSDLGIAFGLFAAIGLGIFGSVVSGLSAEAFLILVVAIFGTLAFLTAFLGMRRLANGQENKAFALLGWSVSSIGFPLTIFVALDTFRRAIP
jgi:hypothetical protein